VCLLTITHERKITLHDMTQVYEMVNSPRCVINLLYNGCSCMIQLSIFAFGDKCLGNGTIISINRPCVPSCKI